MLAFYGLIALEPLAWSQPNYSIVAGLTFGGVWMPIKKDSVRAHIFMCSQSAQCWAVWLMLNNKIVFKQETRESMKGITLMWGKETAEPRGVSIRLFFPGYIKSKNGKTVNMWSFVLHKRIMASAAFSSITYIFICHIAHKRAFFHCYSYTWKIFVQFLSSCLKWTLLAVCIAKPEKYRILNNNEDRNKKLFGRI